MKLEFLMFWTRETMSNIRRNRLMSLLSISTVSIGLFVLGACFLTLSNLRAAVGQETQKLDIVAFLKADTTPERRKAIYEACHIAQVSDLEIVTKDRVLAEMRRDPNFKDIPVEDFRNSNPLNDELRLKLRNPQNDIFAVRAYLASIPEVLDVRAPAEDAIVHRLLKINLWLTRISLIALGVLGLGILLIIHNSIRLTIFARRREIRIMELVGATSGFIRMPFLLEGMIYGVLGALLAALILGPLYLALTRINEPLLHLLMPLAQAPLWDCVSGMLLAGLLFGLLGSWISLSRSIGRAAQI